MRPSLSKLVNPDSLTRVDLVDLLASSDQAVDEALRSMAKEYAVRLYGRGILVRGLIEVSNFCANDCLYCGIRRSNRGAVRYRLSPHEVLECCAVGYEIGFRTFVLQGGEDPYWRGERLVEVVRSIRSAYPDCAITLSLGEMTPDEYRALHDAGANRYLLRHETYNEAHYRTLHPDTMSRDHRLACLDALREIGYQVGTGVMVGSPGQTIEHLAEDLDFIRCFRPEMIGVGPFIPHEATPFAEAPAGTLALTLRFLALCRILCPSALIPATTAIATLSSVGRREAILSGCNVVMPNLSPASHRADYTLYNNKASLGSESAEGVQLLSDQLASFGYHIDWRRGDFGDSII